MVNIPLFTTGFIHPRCLFGISAPSPVFCFCDHICIYDHVWHYRRLFICQGCQEGCFFAGFFQAPIMAFPKTQRFRPSTLLGRRRLVLFPQIRWICGGSLDKTPTHERFLGWLAVFPRKNIEKSCWKQETGSGLCLTCRSLPGNRLCLVVIDLEIFYAW